MGIVLDGSFLVLFKEPILFRVYSDLFMALSDLVELSKPTSPDNATKYLQDIIAEE